jgi:acid stress-induced BolA-like protein IbaG/YrbA
MTQPWDSLEAQMKQAIEAAIPQAEAQVMGNGGHFSIRVVSPEFAGKRTLEKQRMVYSAIQPFMSGSNAPVHAVDQLETLVPPA